MTSPVGGTALVLPGRRYGHDQAGLHLVELALERAGLELVLAEWPAAGMPQDVDEAAAAVAAVATPLLDRLGEAPAYVVAKSLGTLAAPLAAERGIPGIWLTPLLREPVCRDAILRNPSRQLLIGGQADPAWDPTVADEVAHAGISAIELPGADHGFLVEGDAAATASTLVLLTRAVLEFVS